MAQIIGSSEAWTSVLKHLPSKAAQEIKVPADIEKYKETLRKEKINWKENGLQYYQLYKQQQEEKLRALNENTKQKIQRRKKQDQDLLLSYRKELRQLQQEKNFLIYLLSIFKRKFLKKKILQTKRDYQVFIEEERLSYEKERKSIDSFSRDPQTFINERIKVIEKQIEHLTNLKTLPEYFGALAELELIRSLKTLPNSYFVFNDIHLALDSSISFDKGWLRSAQIDHLVLAPTGLFVIETKNWSKSFSQGNTYFDPYQQIKRAGYLCFLLIGKRYGIKVRQILAYKSHLPSQKEPSYTKILPIQDVKGYILWFEQKEALLNTTKLQEIASYIQEQNIRSRKINHLYSLYQ